MNARLVSATSNRPGIKVKDMAGRRTEDNFPKAKRPPPIKAKPIAKKEMPKATSGTRASSKHRLRKNHSQKSANPPGDDTTLPRFIRRRQQFGENPLRKSTNSVKSARRDSTKNQSSSDKNSRRSSGYKKTRRPVRGA